jgi:protein ImuA
MSLPIPLDRRVARPQQPLPGGPAQGLYLVRGRVHEFCGPARITLAALVMERSEGPVIWACAGWTTDRICPDGLAAFANPARLILARARRAEDILWAAEEALRSGAAPLVIAELPTPPALTPVRRLHLAAEAGAEAAHHQRGRAPLGLLLIPGDGGAQGVESRWHMQAAPSRTTLIEWHEAWLLSRRRAREHPPASWQVSRDDVGQTDVAQTDVAQTDVSSWQDR